MIIAYYISVIGISIFIAFLLLKKYFRRGRNFDFLDIVVSFKILETFFKVE